MKLLVTLLAIALVPFARCDDCLAFVPQKEGTIWEQTSFNKKGKAVGKVEYRLASIETEGGRTDFHVEQTSFDKKGESIYNGDLKYSCEEGTFYIDMSSFVDPQQLGMHGGGEFKINTDAIGFPSDISPGQTLGNGSISLELGLGGPIKMNMVVEVMNRKVEAKETVETTAGSFECYRISQEIVTRTIMVIKVKSVDWIAPGIGSVKTESYNMRGKLMGYMELTRLEKP